MTAPTMEAAPIPAESPAPAIPTPQTDGLHPAEMKWPSAETPTDESTPPSEDAASPTPDAEPTEPTPEPEPVAHTVEMVLPNGNGENGTTNAGRFVIELENQEAADGLRYHLKQSARVPVLEKKLDQHQGDVATMQFMRQHPVDGMLLVAEQVPEAGPAFAESWMAAHPVEAALSLRKLGFSVEYASDEETVKIRAENAQLKAQEKLRQGRQDFEATRTESRFASTAQDVIREMASTLGLAEGQAAYRLFATAAAEELSAYAVTQPQATSPDMTMALKDLVATYATLHQKQDAIKARVAEQPRNTVGEFTKLAAKNDKFRKLAGGATVVAPLSAVKIPPGQTMDQQTEQLRARGRW